MKKLDNIEELFKKGLKEAEFPVRSELWSGIQSGLSSAAGSTTAVAATSSKIGVLVIKSIVGLSVVGLTTYFIVKNTETSKNIEPTTMATTSSNAANVKTTKEAIEEKSSKIAKTGQKEHVMTLPQNKNEESLLRPKPKSNEANLSVPSQKEKTKGENQNIPAETETQQNTPQQKQSETQTTKPTESNDKVKQNASKSNPVSIPNIEKDNTSSKTNVATALPSETKSEKNISDVILSLPNGFTPNGDGYNDLFYVPLNKEAKIKTFDISIFNIAGNLVFKSNDPNFTWDGNDMKGQAVDDGTCLYVVSIETEEGERYEPKMQKLTLERKR